MPFFETATPWLGEYTNDNKANNCRMVTPPLPFQQKNLATKIRPFHYNHILFVGRLFQYRDFLLSLKSE
jgi:hypothetical protein